MIKIEKVADYLLEEGHSLTEYERQRAQTPFDQLYIDEKIKKHERLLFLSKLVIVALVLLNALSLLVLFFFNNLSELSQNWLRVILAVLYILTLFGLPTALINHGRNATILRVIRRLHKDEAEQDERLDTEEGLPF